MSHLFDLLKFSDALGLLGLISEQTCIMVAKEPTNKDGKRFYFWLVINTLVS